MSSPLASSSRHNLDLPHPPRHAKDPLRLLLAAAADETDSDDDIDVENHQPIPLLSYPHHHDDDQDDHDDDDSDLESDTEVMRRAKRARHSASHARIFTSPTKRLAHRTTAASPRRAAAAAPFNATPTKARRPILIKGNVTPSKAFSIFKNAKANRATRTTTDAKELRRRPPPGGLLTPPPSSPALPSSSATSAASTSTAPLRLSQTTPRSSARSACTSIGVDGFFSPANHHHLPPAALLSSHAAAPTPLAIRHLLASAHPASTFTPASASVQDAFWSLKTRRSAGSWGASSLTSLGRQPRLNANSFLSTYLSPPTSVMRLPLTADAAVAHPLCSSYSFSSRSVNPRAQWLAVGDDQGRLSLLNTLPPHDDGAQEYTDTPSWLAVDAEQQDSIFELAWRFDDRVILSGASDYVIRSWDVEYQVQLDRFEAHRGSPRSIGDDRRDGATTASAGAKAPVLSIWSAHTSAAAAGSRGAKGRASFHHVAPGARTKRSLPPKGVTSLCYLNDGSGHRLVSAGCENGVLKCWDLRTWSSGPAPAASTEFGSVKVGTAVEATRGRDKAPRARSKDKDLGPSSVTPDLTLLSAANRRSHGVSHLVASSTHIFASSTDGRIYNVPASSFVAAPSPAALPASSRKGVRAKKARPVDPSDAFGRADMEGPTPSSLFGLVTPAQGRGKGEAGGGLYDASQRQNTLYAKMALYDDRFLAVGCNTGEVGLWDLGNPCASTASRSQVDHDDDDDDDGDDDEEDVDAAQLAVAREMGYGIANASRSKSTSSGHQAVVLRGGHSVNAEINSLSWCNGPMGPMVTSVGDDAVVRSWVPDRAGRQRIDDEEQERRQKSAKAAEEEGWWW
ncbi:uncharacterized protein PFL1_04803 [Pseudozyma flocculosa PF-1]|uniref:Uncharacterized protein n=1 Tax=Pseudozyma flocculosa PF-1 TaxID=1277687 RepID=A0A061H6M4_9BASI|nr:uncharacterized protein PFL1_04803 [Pseudozyma flocculosa PF-1]EPQ27665.1 hypothetical protein PFL1_04803 [Pseudozyma flocculosa PF-1]